MEPEKFETADLVAALVALGVQGPALAGDVLEAAGLNLPTAQRVEVLNELVRYRANQALEAGAEGSS